MALVKKSELSGRIAARATSATAIPATPTISTPVSKRREQNRSRARQEKAAERIGAATEQLAAGLSQAAAASEELGRSLQQIAKTAEMASAAAQQSQAGVAGLTPMFDQAKERAELSRRKTESLQDALQEAALHIQGLGTAVQDNAARQLRSVELVTTLERQAVQVADLTETVGDVADQTNLLALNAAIEAARAGQHGRGFAVIADEVRAFAGSTEKSAREVKTAATAIASQIQDIAARLKAAAELAASEAGKGQEIITTLAQARGDMNVIALDAESVFQNVMQAGNAAGEAQKGAEVIASAAEEQSASTIEARKAVQQQSTSLEQSQKTAQALAQLAEALQTESGAELSAEQVASSSEQLSATVQELAGAATEILAAIEQINRGAEAQSSAAQQSAAALTQIHKATSAVREAASRSVEKGDVLAPILKVNQEAVGTIIAGVVSAAEETESVTSKMVALEDSGRQIERTAEAISLVAVQVNMLAVSGSIEAARAGEAGRGFAVVSTDIRKLAQDTATNAERVKDVVRLIRDQITTVRRDLEQMSAISRGEARRNLGIVDKLAAVETDIAAIRAGFAEILEASDAGIATVREVLAGTQQIASGAEETNAATAQAASAANQQARGAEDLAAAIEEIASLADELQIAKA
jgi:methyl-accepting chemotaxis protein